MFNNVCVKNVIYICAKNKNKNIIYSHYTFKYNIIIVSFIITARKIFQRKNIYLLLLILFFYFILELLESNTDGKNNYCYLLN